MTREQINEMLSKMSEEERKVILNLDDALDAYMSYKLGERFGVKIECNPNGDRSKIAIDSKVMDHEEFEKWYERKCMHESLDNFLDSMYSDDEDEDEEDEDCDDDLDYDDDDEIDDEDDDKLPENVKIAYSELQNPYDDKEVRGYLRNKYGYYLKGNSYGPNIDCDDNKKIVYVTDIEWGRKR